MQGWELSAREAVRDLVARYNQYGDAGRFDELVALFDPAATLRTDDEVVTGPEGLRAFFRRVAGPAPEYVRHFTATLQVDLVAPERATARSYYQVLTADGLDHWGRYADEFGTRDGRWLFTSRRVRLDGMQPGGWAADYQRRRHEAP